MKALIAMSGGVDSSVAACLTRAAGYDCIGCTMKLYENEDAGIDRSRTCCSLDDVEDARSVAHRLGMPYYVFNFTEDFREQIIGKFIRSYEQGRTPNPCIDCNRCMKFEKLCRRARELGCDKIVTGHYARIQMENGRYTLKRALDPAKDQSYVLYMLTQEQLAMTLLPLGELTKQETRRIAAENGFLNAEKPDSQDICFVPDGDYARVIRLHTGREYAPGPFVDREGRVLGTHRGIIHYTIGQRRGLGVSAENRLYVVSIRPTDNTVVLGSNDDLFSRELTAEGFNWIMEPPAGEIRCEAKIRYRHPAQPARAKCLEDGRVQVVFDQPQRAITAGQSVVLYDGDTVLGGGEIQ